MNKDTSIDKECFLSLFQLFFVSLLCLSLFAIKKVNLTEQDKHMKIKNMKENVRSQSGEENSRRQNVVQSNKKKYDNCHQQAERENNHVRMA